MKFENVALRIEFKSIFKGPIASLHGLWIGSGGRKTGIVLGEKSSGIQQL